MDAVNRNIHITRFSRFHRSPEFSILDRVLPGGEIIEICNESPVHVRMYDVGSIWCDDETIDLAFRIFGNKAVDWRLFIFLFEIVYNNRVQFFKCHVNAEHAYHFAFGSQ